MINQIFFTPKILHKKMTMKTSMTLWITPPPMQSRMPGTSLAILQLVSAIHPRENHQHSKDKPPVAALCRMDGGDGASFCGAKPNDSRNIIIK